MFEKIVSNACVIESVSTNVPLTVAIPSTIANAVRNVLSFRAQSPRSAIDLTSGRSPPSPRSPSDGSERGSSLTMLPSARKRMRSAIEAERGSCVTITVVWPASWTAWRRSSRISPPVFESRLPVGSSAKTTVGFETRARAIATRCC